MTITQFKEKFPAFWQAWTKVHEDANAAGKGQRGHGPDHDQVVLGYTLILAGENERLAEMSGCAALLHSYDRLDAEEKIAPTIEQLGDYFTGEELAEIYLGVHRHNRPNADDDLPTQIFLQDADKLANVGPLIIARSGQFLSTIPVIELDYRGLEKNPAGTYREPKSVHDDLLGCLEWESDPRFGLRTEKAKVLGKPYFDFLREFFRLTEQQFIEVGL